MKKHFIFVVILVALASSALHLHDTLPKDQDSPIKTEERPRSAPRRSAPTHGLSVDAIQLGMPEAEVRAIWGEPVTEGRKCPLVESVRPSFGGWWLNYETPCELAKSGGLKGHKAPHVHLNEKGGHVDFVAGPDLYKDGKEVRPESVDAEISDKSAYGASDDCCYYFYPTHSLIVRGCQGSDEIRTFYLSEKWG